jgi:hypothetical protein
VQAINPSIVLAFANILHRLQIRCATLQAHVTHPELKATFQLPIIGVKKNPSSPLYTQLGVLTKGTIIEVNVSELGLVTTTGVLCWPSRTRLCDNSRCFFGVWPCHLCANGGFGPKCHRVPARSSAAFLRFVVYPLRCLAHRNSHVYWGNVCVSFFFSKCT